MKVGIISDTHGLLRPEVFDAFADVDRILHAGDVGDEDLLDALATIAPVTAVWGNTDDWPLRRRLEERARLDLGGVSILVLHGHQFDRPTAARVAAAAQGTDLVVFGHSHRPEVDRQGGTLAVNPGSAGPRRFRLPVTVAIARIATGQVEVEIVELLETRD